MPDARIAQFRIGIAETNPKSRGWVRGTNPAQFPLPKTFLMKRLAASIIDHGQIYFPSLRG
jgi:hypothetical protein